MGFLTLGYCSRTIEYCFPLLFSMIFLGGGHSSDEGMQSRLPSQLTLENPETDSCNAARSMIL